MNFEHTCVPILLRNCCYLFQLRHSIIIKSFELSIIPRNTICQLHGLLGTIQSNYIQPCRQIVRRGEVITKLAPTRGFCLQMEREQKEVVTAANLTQKVISDVFFYFILAILFEEIFILPGKERGKRELRDRQE